MAQYCYYNNNTSNPIHCINLNGNTYRKMNVNGTPYTISTWYSGTCVNGKTYESTYSKGIDTESHYTHAVTIQPKSYNGASWVNNGSYSLSTLYAPYPSDNMSMSTNQGWGSAGYMAESFYTGNTLYRQYFTYSPPDKAKQISVTITNSYSYYVSRSIKSQVFFSYSTSALDPNATYGFAPVEFNRYYNISTHPYNGKKEYNDYTISRNLVQNSTMLFEDIQTHTF